MEVKKGEHFVYDNNSTETTVTIIETDNYAMIRWDKEGKNELSAHYDKKCDKFLNLNGPFGEKVKSIVGNDYKKFKALSKIVDSGLNTYRKEMLNSDAPHVYSKDTTLENMKKIRNKQDGNTLNSERPRFN